MNKIGETNKMRAVLIGYGEVGKGLYEVLSFYHEMAIHDPDLEYLAYDDFLDPDLLLISIPYNEKFIEVVGRYQSYFKPKATVVFSSVPVGTCSYLGAIHSPIEGQHDNMAKSIRAFPRWIGGGRDYWEIDLAVNFFLQAGLKIVRVQSADITEFLKLQSTTIYGINIEWARYCKQVLDSLGAGYEMLKDYNRHYNKLVMENGQWEYQRCNLGPPPGKIGGHCVLPNAKLLQKGFGHSFIQTVLDLNEAKE